ncbi:hypothetical protein LIER_23228 [Lithospermum erythrorhizon]|uniref:Uncharacterized protein n=1 Tax=Lithospermum erythrorhizon TaxID=34254 RepID=A0AAV3R0V9_LITER
MGNQELNHGVGIYDQATTVLVDQQTHRRAQDWARVTSDSFSPHGDEGESLPEDAVNAPPDLEEDVKITVDEIKEVNLGTDDEPRPTYISALLTPEEEAEYVTLLKDFKDIFSWIYKEMPGLDPNVAVHHLAIKESVKPVK